jgi:predicted ATPase
MARVCARFRHRKGIVSSLMAKSGRYERFFVITGGPGAGKTSTIDALERAAYGRSLEAGRAIIQEQVAVGGSALPWADQAAFAELMLARELRSYREAQQHDGRFIFDRGVPDVVGYLRLCGQSPPAHVLKAAETFRYNRTVFLAPPWRAIFTHDSERRQDFSEAVRTCEVMAETYAGLGYNIVELPRVSIPERVAFLVHAIKHTEAEGTR